MLARSNENGGTLNEATTDSVVHVTGILEYRDADGRVIKSVPFETDVTPTQETDHGMDL